ncbi:MAG: hypothetical protein QOE14_931, partial [Humisphaera sp.]|nr:hypothetical protein [Humisphaera sp.]
MARRVNTKFLTILTCVVLGLAATGVLAKKFLIRESPEKYVNAGKQLMSEKKYEEAARNFAHAVALNPKDASLWVQYGDALNELTPQDPEYLKKASDMWQGALAVDASNKAALDRMMSFWSDLANMNSTHPPYFERLHDTAARLYAADPKNSAAEVAMVTSIIRPWLAGVEKDQKDIEDHVAKLLELMKRHPENPDLPMFAAQAKLRLAERKRAQDPASKVADALIAEAGKIVEEAVARTPTAAMYFSAAQVYQAQELNELQARRNSTVWRQKKRDMYTKASSVAKVDDPLYPIIHINAARAVTDEPAAAEKILRDLMQKMPDDQHVRLALAEQLAQVKENRKEAMEILERPVAGSTMTGPKALMAREMQVNTLVALTNLRLEQYSLAKEDERKKLIAPIQDGLAKIEAKEGVGLRSLRLKGKLLRVQGETIEAIQTLEKARQLAEQRFGNIEQAGTTSAERWEVIDLLAKAYVETNQMGRAKMLLDGLIERFPGYDPARMLLTQILIKDGSFDDARVHIEYFKRKDPNNPEVMKLAIQLMDPKATMRDASKEAERKLIRDTFARLPETTKPEILDKANAAMVVDNPEDAVR